MRFGRRHAQLQGGVIQRAWADPAQAFLNRLQHGKKQVAFRTRRQAVGTGVAVRSTQRSRFAWGRCKLFERRINSSFLRSEERRVGKEGTSRRSQQQER